MSIYDQKTIDKYLSRSNFDPKLEPHIYALADNVRTIKTSLFWSFFLGGAKITDREFKFNLRRIFPLHNTSMLTYALPTNIYADVRTPYQHRC